MLVQDMIDRSEFTGFYLLKNATVKQTNDNKSYLDMVICDVTGEMPLKFWDISDMDKETYFSGCIVKLKGAVSVYREKLQAKVIKIRLATDEDGFQVSDFIKSAPIPAADLMESINRAVLSISNVKIKNIVGYCVGKVREKLWTFPAAKSVHHAYYSGLAYHIVRMIELGEFVCKQRPFLNRDLVVGGIILHDLCKTEEYEGGEQGIVTEYTIRGNLLGHISMMGNWIYEAALRYEYNPAEEIVMALQHLVLSHHGKLEYSSPVLPQLAEAIALSQIDTMDAKLQAVEDALDLSKEECITGIRAIEGGRIYRMNLDNE